MSNYPENMRMAQTHSVSLYCEDCDIAWYSEALTDLGSTDIDELNCEECGKEGKIQ